jgi:hypothetical protein
MRVEAKRSLAALLVLGVATVAGATAQQAPAPAATAAKSPAQVTTEAMAKVGFLLGRWEGEGRMRRGPGEPETSQVVERVSSKLGGQVVVLEGLGTVPGAAGAPPRVVHEAYGVLSYDPQKGQYLLRAITAEGRTVDADIEVGDRRLVWGFATPGGRVRYTLSLDEGGRWQERGEHSRDGATWSPFFEMSLRRVGDA